MSFPLTNQLLDSLSASDRSSIDPGLQHVDLPVGTVLFEAGQIPRYVYLMTSGAASVVSFMVAGEAVEVGLTGREGIPGSVHLLGSQQGATRCFIQLAGSGFRMGFRAFEELFFENTALHRRVLQFVQYEALMLGQLSACNRVHEVEERLARWLLMVSDRIGSDEMELTQEFLSEMLGTRRSTVTVVAGTLQRSGYIEYRRGRVHIIDRARLEEAACECYPITRKIFQGLYKDPLPGAR